MRVEELRRLGLSLRVKRPAPGGLLRPVGDAPPAQFLEQPPPVRAEAREGGGIKTGNVQGWFLRRWYTGGGLRLNTVVTGFLLNHTVIFMHFSSFPKNNYLTADLRYALLGP